MKNLIKYLNNYSKLSPATEKAIQQLYKLEYYKKNEFILREGKVCEKLGFIQAGLVRRFYYNEENEVTRWIYSENEFISSLPSFFKQIPSRENFQACEDCAILTLNYKDEEKLFEYPDYERLHRILLREYISSLSEFHYSFKVMSSEQKYEYIGSYFPEILKRAKLGHVASLIGITQETLSRLRAKK